MPERPLERTVVPAYVNDDVYIVATPIPNRDNSSYAVVAAHENDGNVLEQTAEIDTNATPGGSSKIPLQNSHDAVLPHEVPVALNGSPDPLIAAEASVLDAATKSESPAFCATLVASQNGSPSVGFVASLEKSNVDYVEALEFMESKPQVKQKSAPDKSGEPEHPHSLLDTDGDGKVSREEWRSRGKRPVELATEDPTSSSVRQANESEALVDPTAADEPGELEHSLLDTDGDDGKVSREEWRSRGNHRNTTTKIVVGGQEYASMESAIAGVTKTVDASSLSLTTSVASKSRKDVDSDSSFAGIKVAASTTSEPESLKIRNKRHPNNESAVVTASTASKEVISAPRIKGYVNSDVLAEAAADVGQIGSTGGTSAGNMASWSVERHSDNGVTFSVPFELDESEMKKRREVRSIVTSYVNEDILVGSSDAPAPATNTLVFDMNPQVLPKSHIDEKKPDTLPRKDILSDQASEIVAVTSDSKRMAPEAQPIRCPKCKAKAVFCVCDVKHKSGKNQGPGLLNVMKNSQGKEKVDHMIPHAQKGKRAQVQQHATTDTLRRPTVPPDTEPIKPAEDAYLDVATNSYYQEVDYKKDVETTGPGLDESGDGSPVSLAKPAVSGANESASDEISPTTAATALRKMMGVSFAVGAGESDRIKETNVDAAGAVGSSARSAHHALDINGDGIVSRDEWQACPQSSLSTSSQQVVTSGFGSSVTGLRWDSDLFRCKYCAKSYALESDSVAHMQKRHGHTEGNVAQLRQAEKEAKASDTKCEPRKRTTTFIPPPSRRAPREKLVNYASKRHEHEGGNSDTIRAAEKSAKPKRAARVKAKEYVAKVGDWLGLRGDPYGGQRVLSTCTSMKAVSTAVALTTIVPTAVSRIEDYELDEDMYADGYATSYNCEYCEKAYTLQSDALMHMRVRHGHKGGDLDEIRRGERELRPLKTVRGQASKTDDLTTIEDESTDEFYGTPINLLEDVDPRKALSEYRAFVRLEQVYNKSAEGRAKLRLRQSVIRTPGLDTARERAMKIKAANAELNGNADGNKILAKKEQEELTRAKVLELPTYKPRFIQLISVVNFCLFCGIFLYSISTEEFGEIGVISSSTPCTPATASGGGTCPLFPNGTENTGASKVYPVNPWIGPTTAVLSRFSASVTACMRLDLDIFEENTNQQRVQCLPGAACEYNGPVIGAEEFGIYSCCLWSPIGSSTVQGMTTKAECDSLPGSSWEWEFPGSGRVVCSDGVGIGIYETMIRPCCFGNRGRCDIITESQCSFLDGTWNADSLQCPEVACLSDSCTTITGSTLEVGYSDGSSDQGAFGAAYIAGGYQWWRFVCPLFSSSGIIHYIITGVPTYLIGCQLERAFGHLRVAIIYFVSGVGGYIVSGLLDPETVTCGNNPALFGLFAVLFVELAQAWPAMKLYKQNPVRELIKLCIFLTLALVLGTLPFIDNFAQLGGFVYGLLCSVVVLPHITLGGEWHTRGRKILFFICLPLLFILFLLAIVYFYSVQSGFCSSCRAFNCVRWHDDLECS